VGLTLLASLAGCGEASPSAEEATSKTAEPVFGETDPETLLQLYGSVYAVSLWTIPGGGVLGGNCSGTQVRENVVLTARHCVTSNGTPNGTVVAANRVNVGLPGSENPTPSQTNAQCAASNTCNTVASIVAGVTDWALLFLTPGEVRLFSDPAVYVPMVWPAALPLGGITGPIAVASYGMYNPFSVNDPANLKLNFGELDILSLSAPTSIGGATGQVVKTTGVGSTMLQGGDSGTGYWVKTRPPGLVAVHSGGENCVWGAFCARSEGPHVYSADPTVSTPDALVQQNTVSRSWEFANAAERADFDEFVVATGQPPAGSLDGWWVSSGNYTQWKNIDATMTIASSAMETGCVRTRVSTTDDDSSGIVFRYMDPYNYYLFEATDQGNTMTVRYVIDGVSTTLATGTWTGNWAATTMMVCFQKYGTIDAYIGDSSSAALHTGTTHIYGGRYGFYNRFNEAARHSWLRTTTLEAGLALVQ
jgi:hypothetical protein